MAMKFEQKHLGDEAENKCDIHAGSVSSTDMPQLLFTMRLP
jgi:hypothetical protein